MIIPAAVLVALSAYLLQGDVWTFWTWYLLALVLGVAAMPLTGRLFRRFDDKGWIFSKVTAIAITGFLTWFLVTVKILKFTAVTCVAVTVICGRASFLCILSYLDIFCRIPSSSLWNREIYGLWFHGSNDAKQNTSGNRSLVF